MRLASPIALLGASALALTLVSCEGAGGGCATNGILPAILLYPIPGTSGVPDNAPDLIVTGVVIGGATYSLTSSTAPTILGGTAQALPSPLPTPIAVGTPQLAIPIAGLATHTTYSVNVSAIGTGCSEHAGGSIGTFITQ